MNLLFTHSYHLPLYIICTCLSPALAGYFLQHFIWDHTMQRAGASGSSRYKRAGTFCYHAHSSTTHQENFLSLSARPGKVKLLACKDHFKKKGSSQFKNVCITVVLLLDKYRWKSLLVSSNMSLGRLCINSRARHGACHNSEIQFFMLS